MNMNTRCKSLSYKWRNYYLGSQPMYCNTDYWRCTFFQMLKLWSENFAIFLFVSRGGGGGWKVTNVLFVWKNGENVERPLTFKCLKHIAPEYLSSNFTFVHSIHSKCTRSQSQNSLFVPMWKTSSGKRTFLYRGSVAWNRLPSDTRINLDSMTLNQLKNLITL
jgi:hypothetical protein